MENLNENVELLDGFNQVCVWTGTLIEKDGEQEVIDWFLDNFNVRVQILETIVTLPDVDDVNTGGRSDLFFAIHGEDVGKFVMPKLQIGARWLEDVVGEWNGYDENPIYPERVLEYPSSGRYDYN